MAGALATSDVRPTVADDGTVAFASASGNLVAGDTNGLSDVFLRLGATGGTPTTVRVSLSATGAQLAAPLLDARDGMRVLESHEVQRVGAD